MSDTPAPMLAHYIILMPLDGTDEVIRFHRLLAYRNRLGRWPDVPEPDAPLVPVPAPTPEPAPPTPPAPPRRYATVDKAKTPSLRLRSAPNAADPANIVGAITPADGPLEILGERRVGTTTWYELDAKGLRGWASGSYLIVSGG